LALALGMPVGELLRRTSALELVEWQEYARLEPFGEWRADARAGIIASAAANSGKMVTAALARKRSVKLTQPADFMPKFSIPPEAETDEERKPRWQDMLQIVEMLNAAFGGQDLRRETP